MYVVGRRRLVVPCVNVRQPAAEDALRDIAIGSLIGSDGQQDLRLFGGQANHECQQEADYPDATTAAPDSRLLGGPGRGFLNDRHSECFVVAGVRRVVSRRVSRRCRPPGLCVLLEPFRLGRSRLPG